MRRLSTDEYTVRAFRWEHLPEYLQRVSAPFAAVAAVIVDMLPPSKERDVCLRKLLEAKDCAVRAAVDEAELQAGRI